MRISSGAVLIVFLHLIEHSLSLDSKSPAVADFGLNLGSVAAAKIAQNAARLSLERPKSLQLHVKTDESPWFDPIAFVDSRTGIALGPMNVHFHSDQVEAYMEDFSIKTIADINFLTLPFLGDTAHFDIAINRAYVQFKLDSMNVTVEKCDISTKNIQLYVDRSFLLNPLLYVASYAIPTRTITTKICSELADRLIDLQKRIAVGIPFASIVPSKVVPNLVSPNIFIYIRLDSLKADNEQLTLNAAFDWYNGSSDQLSSPSHSVFFEDDPHLSSIAETTILNPSSPTSSDLSNKIEFDSPQDPDSSLEQETKGFGVEEKMHLWVEDRLMNELLQQFRWDFKWIDERLQLSDPKIPDEFRTFLITLCADCFILINVSANGVPAITVENGSIIIETFNRGYIAGENRTKIITTLIDLSLTLVVGFTPTIENGVFRTRLDLLHHDVKIQNGSAIPPPWFGSVETSLKKMISEDLWPTLQKGLEKFIYTEGVKIPPRCGIKPSSAQLHFDGGRIGISAALDLDHLSIDHCVNHLRNKLPSLDKLISLEAEATTMSPFMKNRKRW